MRRRRSTNLEWIKALPVEQLQKDTEELLVPMAYTANREIVFIQYPGKESKLKVSTNPRDFRPKVRLAEEKKSVKDLRFKDLWDAVFDNLRSIENEKERANVASTLGILFYRMAFLVDYELRTAGNYDAIVIRGNEDMGQRTVKYGPFWNYQPPKLAVNEISRYFPNWGGMSFEAFLHYNSLLAWNEDGKSYAKFPGWTLAKPIGRVNTILTHMRMTGLAIGVVEISSVLDDYARRRGVCPVHADEIVPISGDFILAELEQRTTSNSPQTELAS